MKKKLSYYKKSGQLTSYTRTTKVEKKLPIKDLVDELGKKREKYLSHRKVVDNDKAIWPEKKGIS